MPDEDLPPLPRSEIDALLRAAPWSEIHPELVRFALAHTKNPERAEDVAHHAISRVLDASYRAWDPRVKTLKLFLMSLVRDELSNKRKRVHREIAMASEEKATSAERAAEIAASKVAIDAPSPEAELVAHDMKARRVALLRKRLEANQDAQALRVLEMFEQGVDRPAELALALGVPLAIAIKARDRLFYQGKQVARELDDVPAAEQDDADERSDAAAENARPHAHYDESPESTEDVA